MALRLLPTVLRRNPANYAVRWGKTKHEEHLPLTPIRRAYPDSWITASLNRDGAFLMGNVQVVTADHGPSEETREMSRTLSPFGIFDTHADMFPGPNRLQLQVMEFVGSGTLPRVYSKQVAFSGISEAKAFVDRVIAALQNSADKFERVGAPGREQIRLRK